jgi:hypothetical protein
VVVTVFPLKLNIKHADLLRVLEKRDHLLLKRRKSFFQHSLSFTSTFILRGTARYHHCPCPNMHPNESREMRKHLQGRALSWPTPRWMPIGDSCAWAAPPGGDDDAHLDAIGEVPRHHLRMLVRRTRRRRRQATWTTSLGSHVHCAVRRRRRHATTTAGLGPSRRSIPGLEPSLF